MGTRETIGKRLQRDLAAMSSLPSAPYEACAKATGRVSSQSPGALQDQRLLRFLAPMASAMSTIRAFVDAVEIGCGGQIIARHPRCYEARADGVQSGALLCASGEKARRAGSGRALGRLGDARRAANPAPPDGSASGPDRGDVSSSRFYVCWKVLICQFCARRCAWRCKSGRSPLMRSSIWCCVRWTVARHGSTCRSIPICLVQRCRPQRPQATWRCCRRAQS